MGKHTNVIAFILSAFFMFGAIGTISVYAEGEVEPYPGYSEPIFEPATDPVYTESPYEPEPVYTDPPYDPGSSSVDPAPYNPGGDSSNNSSSWNDGGNVYSSNSATEQVYGGVQQSSQISQNNNIQNTTPSASLYNAQGKTINDKTLSSGDWSEIAANLKNADAKAGAGDPALKTRFYPEQIQVARDGRETTVTKLNDGPVLKVADPPEGEQYYKIGDEIFMQVYARILICRKRGDVK